MKVLIVDNYDSFTYNLVEAVRQEASVEATVVRNDQIEEVEVEHYSHLLLSPGPGIPSEAGELLSLIKNYATTKRILGICLGFQAIGEAFGGVLRNLPKVYHGVATQTTQVTPDPIFEGLNSSFMVGRYHSWVLDEEQLPSCLRVTCRSEDGLIMGISHSELDVKGVQFHPESILTPDGNTIIRNWLYY